MNISYKNRIAQLALDPQNIATKRIQYLLDIIDFDKIKNILDIGSWHLKQSIEFSQIFEQGVIHAFEPNPETYIRCAETLKSLPPFVKNRIFTHELALSNHNGTSFFYPLDKTKTNSSNEGIASLSKLKNYMDGSLLNDKWIQKEITVSTSTLDAWCLKNHVENIDLLWMDVQGAELKVLEGAKETLSRIKIICTEVGLVPYYEDHATKDQVDKIMFENNFVELKSAFSKTSWSNNLAAEADVIYLNKNFINLP